MSVAAKRTRLSPEARRAQLIDLGMQMLTTRTLEELSVEEIAEQAGISRGLLFHYFRSKQEFHLEVVRAMAHEMISRTEPDPTLAPLEQLRSSLAAYVDYITENPAAYVALVRGAVSADDAMRTVNSETRAAMAQRVLDNLTTLGLPSGQLTEIAVHGWIAFVEEAVIRWLDGSTADREQLLDLLATALPALVSAGGGVTLEQLAALG